MKRAVLVVAWSIITTLWIGTIAAWIFIAFRWWHRGP